MQLKVPIGIKPAYPFAVYWMLKCLNYRYKDTNFKERATSQRKKVRINFFKQYVQFLYSSFLKSGVIAHNTVIFHKWVYAPQYIQSVFIPY
jgi:hypothetical protein